MTFEGSDFSRGSRTVKSKEPRKGTKGQPNINPNCPFVNTLNFDLI